MLCCVVLCCVVLCCVCVSECVGVSVWVLPPVSSRRFCPTSLSDSRHPTCSSMRYGPPACIAPSTPLRRHGADVAIVRIPVDAMPQCRILTVRLFCCCLCRSRRARTAALSFTAVVFSVHVRPSPRSLRASLHASCRPSQASRNGVPTTPLIVTARESTNPIEGMVTPLPQALALPRLRRPQTSCRIQ